MPADEMIYLSIRRSIRELFSHFGELIQTLRDTTEIKVNNPQKVINNVVEHYRLREAQKENILIAFGAEPEYDKYGIANAITRAAQGEENWEKSLELERIGGKLIVLPIEEFKNFDN
jgi:Ribonuclease G/E